MEIFEIYREDSNINSEVINTWGHKPLNIINSLSKK